MRKDLHSKDTERNLGKQRGKAGCCPVAEQLASAPPGRTQKERGAWGRASSGSCAETSVPSPASCTWRAEHGPKEAWAPGESDAHSPTAQVAGWDSGRAARFTSFLCHSLPTCVAPSLHQSKQQCQPLSSGEDYMEIYELPSTQ